MYYDIMDYHIKDQSIIVKRIKGLLYKVSKNYYIKDYYIKDCEFDSHQKIIFFSFINRHTMTV